MTRSIRARTAFRAALVLWLASATIAAGAPPTLRFDPFREREKPAGASAGARAETEDESFEPVLLSTVVGGRRAVANLGGELLAVGEESHGYRLVEVRAFDAVFVKDGKRVRLEVEGRQGEAN